jgi:hypothetical protein
VRFIIFRMADKNTEAGTMPPKELHQAMGDYIEAMAKADVLKGAEGFQPTSKGARVRFSKGSPTVVNGPFASATDIVAGFCLLDVKSKDEAIEWAKKSTADGGGNVELEVPQLHEVEDFGEEFTPDMRDREEQLRQEIAAKR